RRGRGTATRRHDDGDGGKDAKQSFLHGYSSERVPYPRLRYRGPPALRGSLSRSCVSVSNLPLEAVRRARSSVSTDRVGALPVLSTASRRLSTSNLTSVRLVPTEHESQSGQGVWAPVIGRQRRFG